VFQFAHRSKTWKELEIVIKFRTTSNINVKVRHHSHPDIAIIVPSRVLGVSTPTTVTARKAGTVSVGTPEAAPLHAGVEGSGTSQRETTTENMWKIQTVSTSTNDSHFSNRLVVLARGNRAAKTEPPCSISVGVVLTNCEAFTATAEVKCSKIWAKAVMSAIPYSQSQPAHFEAGINSDPSSSGIPEHMQFDALSDNAWRKIVTIPDSASYVRSSF
jgi:hypothetical protein